MNRPLLPRLRPALRRRASHARGGFTLIELTVVILFVMVLLALTAIAFATVGRRMASRGAAQVFSRDLALARSMAVRGRERVTIKFDENARSYEVRTATGRSLANRRFGPGSDGALSALTIDTPGDSLVFSSRGVGRLSGSIGTASFTAGAITYRVSFNAIGASQVAEL